METDTTSYPPPVDKLLTYGDGREVGANVKDWSEYLELGIGPEHIPDLIRMTTDAELRWANSDSLEVWAPIHAWRALGQLHAEAAIEPLLPLFEEAEDDWVMEELPEVYGMIGPAAIPAITAYIADRSHPEWPRIIAMSSLEKIGTMHPDARDECITALTRELGLFDENDPEFNAWIIHDLVELKATEALPIIKRAFAADCVDESIEGDWDEVQVLLGLKSREEVPQRRFQPPLGIGLQAATQEELVPSQPAPLKTFHKHEPAHKKAKNKMAKQSRKKNRRRK